jgi:hypothetical protein
MATQPLGDRGSQITLVDFGVNKATILSGVGYWVVGIEMVP